MALYTGTRFTRTAPYRRYGKTITLDIRRPFNFDASSGTYYTVVAGDTLDVISYKQYGLCKLWWALLDANPQFMCDLDIKPGDVLFVPAYEDVMKWL